MAKAAIALSIELVESAKSLPGSGLWVRELIEAGELAVTETKRGEPAVFLRGTIDSAKRYEMLAVYTRDYKNQPVLDHWPFEGDFIAGDDHEAFGIMLTTGGRKILMALARKAKTLLKYRLRSQDRKANEAFKVTLTAKSP